MYAAASGKPTGQTMAIRVEPKEAGNTGLLGSSLSFGSPEQIIHGSSGKTIELGHAIVFSAIPVALLYTMAKVLEKKSSPGVLTHRQSILQLIQSKPGIHFNEICRVLGIQNGVTQYHLKNLEMEANLIQSHQDGVYHRYFPNNYELLTNERSMEILSLIQRPGMGTIMKILWLSETPMSRDNLANEIGITQQGAGWNCKQLIKNSMLSEQKVGKQKFYSLEPEVMKTLNQLAHYVPSLSTHYI